MRVSLLLQREPFGELLARTLAPYWSAELGQPVDVRWAQPASGDQIWQGNIYLNFFCVAAVNPSCFDIIVQEFGFARSVWRRGLQSAYVRAAVTPPFRSLLSQVSFGVSVPVPDAESKLVIGGNHRLRVIEPARARSTVIHKAGYSRLSFDREVTARRGLATKLAPPFEGVDTSGLAFREEYFAGTPANRMPAAAEEKARQAAVNRLVAEIHRPSMSVFSLDEHVARVCADLIALCPEATNIIGEWKSWFAEFASVPIGVCFTHGDFQGANILVQDRRLHVIDWETASERSQLYDLATLDSQIRLAPVALQAWEQTLARWTSVPASAPRLEVAPESRGAWLAHGGVWWLEEILLQFEESRLAEHLSGHNTRDAMLLQSLGHALDYLRRLK
ncbi:phosphotransferase [Horticoccus luteus]|uniref:Phosphotransferase n=1 Tax=Horticoccus luteus TaxID=2862869 RepID=A0A8F9XIE7_9BACT|nr:phosphotransferase [Horticoccus luteus]QYM77513.1 phosphotransferase [Horticoccus luteus]